MSLTTSLPLATTLAELRSGKRDLLAFVREACQRIEELDPQIQAFLPEPEREARLLAQAARLQERFPDPTQRPPLYGALLGVKDIFAVDGFPMQGGSQLPPALFAGPQASCVTRLCEMGALVVGKTVTTEFAADQPGPTHNPHNIAHTPGGSSSGSAAGIAAGFCTLALGTQTIGSVIRPAAFCGIVGFKPTYGRIDDSGLIHSAASVDTVGLLAQDLAGIALAASLLCQDWQATTVRNTPTLAVPDGPYLAQASSEALDAFAQQLALLENVGYTIKHVEAFDNIEAINFRHGFLVDAEMAQVHKTWFADYEALYRPRTAARIRSGREASEEQLEQARAGRAQLRTELESAMKREGIDLWVCPPAIGPAPEGIASTGSTVMNLPWSHSGMPALTLPAGKAANGLPLGLQIVASSMADEQLLAWAEPMEAVLAMR